MASIDELSIRARADVDRVWNEPEDRYAMREAFYRRWGKSSEGGVGIGRSELDFLRWEIERGVLRSPSSGGSHWWRKVNGGLLFDARLAELTLDADPSMDPGSLASRHWQAFMRSSDPLEWSTLWYRAHNTSIASGYLAAVEEAMSEPRTERVFINMVLYRVLYAQALVQGEAFGVLGRLLADPRMPSVEALLDLPGYYPDHYPMTPDELRSLQHRGHSLATDVLDIVLDDVLILPELDQLYDRASVWLTLPALKMLAANGRPDYPPT
jgi:hypothetical protein